MHKFLFLVFLFFTVQSNEAFAQQRKANQLSSTPVAHDYYIYISGAGARTDVERIENNIQKKSGVSFFLSKGYPARYYRLQSANVITQDQFIAWLNNSGYKVEYFGEGVVGKEKAIMTGKKLKKLQ